MIRQVKHVISLASFKGESECNLNLKNGKSTFFRMKTDDLLHLLDLMGVRIRLANLQNGYIN